MLNSLLYLLAVSAALSIAVLQVATLFVRNFQFWPPPHPSSWQHSTFRVVFRAFFVSLVILSFTTANTTWSPARLALGIPLLLIGFGLAVKWTNFLGWRNAFGEAEGLKTDGIYRWSRNPIYVVSIIGMVGWGLITSSWQITSLLGLWALFYVIASFVEEPWLEEQYGEAFVSYKARVRRFF